MTLRRVAPAFAVGLATLVATLTTVILLLTSTGCSNGNGTPEPAAPETWMEVLGTLVALNDDRSLDGGIDLTLETAPGAGTEWELVVPR